MKLNYFCLTPLANNTITSDKHSAEYLRLTGGGGEGNFFFDEQGDTRGG